MVSMMARMKNTPLIHLETIRQSKKIVWVIIGVFIFAIIALSETRQKSDSHSRKIGAALALTGDAAPWGAESLRSAQLAIDEINHKGGINGDKIELVVEDMKSSTQGGVVVVTKLVNVDGVQAVMITWLDSYAGAESPAPDDLLVISQDAAIESVNTPTNHQNVYSLWYRTSDKARVTLDDMSNSNVKDLFVILQRDSYYSKLLEFLEQEALKQGIKIIGKEMLDPSDDARTTVAKISERKPDAVFFGSYDEALSLNFFKRYYESTQTKARLYGDEFIEQNIGSSNFSPSWLEGISYYVPATIDPIFVDKFKKQFDREPKFSAGTTYDTIYVIAKYLSDHPGNIPSYMKSTKFQTVTYGEIGFDEIGGVIADKPAITMKKILNGKMVGSENTQ